MADSTIQDGFGARLLRALDACNLSRSQLPSLLGVHKSMVSRWLSEEMKPTGYNLARLSAEIAKRRPGFNMSMWTAPRPEFEAALGLHPVHPFAAEAAELPHAKPPHSKPSLAVLPFKNLSGDPDQGYFAEGMMEEVITALGRIRSIFVVGSGSSRSLKDPSLDPLHAARRLGVRYILEGSVRRSGAKVRISVKLTDATQSAQIWAEKFDGTLEDIFALQDQVALSIAGAIEPTVLALERSQAARRPIESLGCYDLYLQATSLRTTLQKDAVFEAIALLDRALSLEPDFAPALGQAASCHSLVVINNWSDDVERHRRLGLTMAERAISSGSGDAAVLAQAANALMDLDNDAVRARVLIDRAIALNPGSAYAQFISGIVSLIEADGDAAAQQFQNAARLDPLSSLGEMARAHMAMAHFVRGDFSEAARIHGQTTYRTPRIHLMMAAVYGHLGEVEQARRELALYGASTTVSPELMMNRVTDAGLRRRGMDGLKRAGIVDTYAPSDREF